MATKCHYQGTGPGGSCGVRGVAGARGPCKVRSKIKWHCPAQNGEGSQPLFWKNLSDFCNMGPRVFSNEYCRYLTLNYNCNMFDIEEKSFYLFF